MSNNLFWFFATSTLFLVLFSSFVFWRTRDTIETFFGGLVFPALVICFFSLLPRVGIIVAFLSTMGVLLIAFITFFFLNECSAVFRERLQRESKISGDVSPIWSQKRKEVGHEHIGVS